MQERLLRTPHLPRRRYQQQLQHPQQQAQDCAIF
jgi:hypothetical protein